MPGHVLIRNAVGLCGQAGLKRREIRSRVYRKHRATERVERPFHDAKTSVEGCSEPTFAIVIEDMSKRAGIKFAEPVNVVGGKGYLPEQRVHLGAFLFSFIGRPAGLGSNRELSP